MPKMQFIIPEMEDFSNGHALLTELGDDSIVADVSFSSAGATIDVPKFSHEDPRQATYVTREMPTVFTLAIDGYIKAVAIAHFGDTIDLDVIPLVRVQIPRIPEVKDIVCS